MMNDYDHAKKNYEAIGVNVEEAMIRLSNIKLSLHCWQGDDVKGFIAGDGLLGGGIASTGNYPYAAHNAGELMSDIGKAFSLIPGQHKVNLHAIYADSMQPLALEDINEEHFKSWLSWAKKLSVGFDFNPTFFSHPMASTGFTLSSHDEKIRKYWVNHAKKSRKIAAFLAKESGQPVVNNIWIPDGFKDTPIDRLSPRRRLAQSLDEIFTDHYEGVIDAVESKLFGIGSESYVVGSHEFYMAYAVKNSVALTLDTGHFHPTEVVSNKLSALSLFTDHMLLHISRPVRWDSDHVVTMDDELMQIAHELVRGDFIEKTSIGLDFFDASINRIAAWVVGSRNVLKALLKAMIEPTDYLKRVEREANYTERLVMIEELKSYPFGVIWDEYCRRMNVPVGMKWLESIKEYEKNSLATRR